MGLFLHGVRVFWFRFNCKQSNKQTGWAHPCLALKLPPWALFKFVTRSSIPSALPTWKDAELERACASLRRQHVEWVGFPPVQPFYLLVKMKLKIWAPNKTEMEEHTPPAGGWTSLGAARVNDLSSAWFACIKIPQGGLQIANRRPFTHFGLIAWILVI